MHTAILHNIKCIHNTVRINMPEIDGWSVPDIMAVLQKSIYGNNKLYPNPIRLLGFWLKYTYTIQVPHLSYYLNMIVICLGHIKLQKFMFAYMFTL